MRVSSLHAADIVWTTRQQAAATNSFHLPPGHVSNRWRLGGGAVIIIIMQQYGVVAVILASYTFGYDEDREIRDEFSDEFCLIFPLTFA